MPISPDQIIQQSRSKNTFTFKPLSSEQPTLTLVTKAASTASEEEDLETLEVLLSQYALLQEIDPDVPGSDGDLKVRVVTHLHRTPYT